METKILIKVLANRLKKTHVQVFISTKPCFKTVISEKSYMDFFFLLSCSFAATFSEAFGKCSEPDSFIAILEALFPCIVQICMKKNSCFFLYDDCKKVNPVCVCGKWKLHPCIISACKNV